MLPNFDLADYLWGGVLQVKQAQPYSSCGNVPMVTIQVYGGSLRLQTAEPTATTLYDRWLWTPTKGDWFKLRLTGYWSQTAAGWVQLRVTDQGVTYDSPTIYGPNLLRACSDSPGINAGDSLQGHLRVGVYVNEARGNESIGVADVLVERQ